MNPIELIVVIAIAIAGLGILGWLLKIIFQAVTPFFSISGKLNPKSMKDQWQMKRRMAMLDDVDAAIKRGDFDSAAKRLKDLFVLDHIRGKAGVLEAVRAHNFLCLSKFISLSQAAKTQVPIISNVESLLDERSRLLSLFQDSSTLHEKIKEKRRREGKGDSWDGGEFEAKIREVMDDIEKNKNELRQEIEAVVTVILRRGGGDVKFH